MIQELDKVTKVGRKYVINQKATHLLLNFFFKGVPVKNRPISYLLDLF